MDRFEFQNMLEDVHHESCVLDFIQEALWFKDEKEVEFSQKALCGVGYVLLNYRERLDRLHSAYFEIPISPSGEFEEDETAR